MNPRSLNVCLLLIVIGLGVSSCSELRDPVPANSPAVISGVHPAGWVQIGNSNFHGRFFITHSNWDLSQCQQCHGQNYAGGITSVGCLDSGCHPSTPEDCSLCHGDASTQRIAPPRDLAGNEGTDARGVGQHTVHLAGGDLSTPFECVTCHAVPASFYAVGHIDSDLPADLTFSGMAVTDGAAPAYNSTTISCSNTYCHGNWSLAQAQSNFSAFYSATTMQGNAEAPGWTDPATGECGTCHALPPTGHNPFPLTACANCHSGVVDGNGNIIDKTKHVNGMVNVFGQEYPMF